MLEIAGAIVIAVVILYVLYLLLPVILDGLHSLLGEFVWIGALFGAVGLWYVGCFAAGELLLWAGPGRMHDFVTLIVPLLMLAGLAVFLVDAWADFIITREIFAALRRLWRQRRERLARR